MSDESNGPYSVGYGRPPRHTQFRKGNPGSRGRRNGSQNFATMVMSTVNESVTVNENGRRKTITKLRAGLKQLVNKAAGGDSRALQLLLNTLRQMNEPEVAARERIVEAEDLQVIEQIVARIRLIGQEAGHG